MKITLIVFAIVVLSIGLALALGLEAPTTQGVGLPTGCANGEIAEYNSTSDSWYCATDNVGSGGSNGSFDLNVTGDSGSGVILDEEVFSILGSGATSTSMSGNTLTITSTDTDTDTTYTAGSNLSLVGTVFSLNGTAVLNWLNGFYMDLDDYWNNATQEFYPLNNPYGFYNLSDFDINDYATINYVITQNNSMKNYVDTQDIVFNDSVTNYILYVNDSVTNSLNNKRNYTDGYFYNTPVIFNQTNFTIQTTSNGQPYLFTTCGDDADCLTIQGQDSNTRAMLRLMSADGDGTDNVVFRLHGVGTPTQFSNRENLRIAWDASNSRYIITTDALGTGQIRPIHIYADGNDQQLVMATNGWVGVGTETPNATLTINGNATITGNFTGDTDFCINGGNCLSSVSGGTYDDGWINNTIDTKIATNNDSVNNWALNTFLQSYTETDPYWTSNYSAFNDSWSYYEANTDSQTLSYQPLTDVITISGGNSIDITEVDTTLSQEEVEDYVGGLVDSNFTYNDAGNSLGLNGGNIITWLNGFYATLTDLNDYRLLSNFTFTSLIFANGGVRLGGNLNANGFNITSGDSMDIDRIRVDNYVNYTTEGIIEYYPNGQYKVVNSTGTYWRG